MNIDWGSVAAVCAIIVFLGGVVRYVVRAEMEKRMQIFKKELEESLGKKFDRIFALLDEWKVLKPNLVTKQDCTETQARCPANKHAENVMMSAMDK
jgi:hypothetical protein